MTRSRWLLFLPLLAASSAAAHDLQVQVEAVAPAVIVRASYAGTDPAAYCQVFVYPPGEKETEHQNGRTDANGVFSFVPDRGGEWLFVIDDEMGHRQEVTVPFEQGASLPLQHGPATMSLTQKLVSGLSVIIGLTGLLYGYKARRQLRESRPQ